MYSILLLTPIFCTVWQHTRIACFYYLWVFLDQGLLLIVIDSTWNTVVYNIKNNEMWSNMDNAWCPFSLLIYIVRSLFCLFI